MGANQTQLGLHPSVDSSLHCDSQRVFNRELLNLFTMVLQDSNPGGGGGSGARFRVFTYFDGLWPGQGDDEEYYCHGMFLSKELNARSVLSSFRKTRI